MFKRTLRSASGGWSGVMGSGRLPSWAKGERAERARRRAMDDEREERAAHTAAPATLEEVGITATKRDREAERAHRERGFSNPEAWAETVAWLQARGLDARGEPVAERRERKPRTVAIDEPERGVSAPTDVDAKARELAGWNRWV